MADDKIAVPESGSIYLDTESLTVGANTVHRERMEIAGAAALEIAAVKAAAPTTTAYGLVVRPVGDTRNAGALHRNAITAVDKLAAPTAMTSGATAATGGSLTASTTYNMVASAYNRWGVTTVPAVLARATAADAPATHVVRGTLAQVTDADGYDVFMSTAAAPLWVARITEAQRASANGVEVTAVGTVQAGSALGAGVIQFNVVGTGQASSATNFAQNNAYIPDASGIVVVNCAGYEVARVLAKLALTDLRSAPSLALIPFFANQVSAADWHPGSLQTVSLLEALGQPLGGDFQVDVKGSTGLKILVDAIGGQGAAVSIWVELA